MGAMDWEQCLREYRRRWWDTPDAVQPLISRLSSDTDPDAFAQQGYRATVHLLQADDEIPVYLFIGLAKSDSFMILVKNQPTVGLALEAYGWQFGATYVGFDDLSHIVAHELCHAVRAHQADTAIARFYGSDGDITPALDRIPIYELLIDEGLAVAIGHAVSPVLPLERILLYSPENMRWCVEHEADLWTELNSDLHRPVGERYRRYFRGGSNREGLPPRVGYFLGYRLVQRYLGEHPSTSLDEAVRMPAIAFVS